eukprot:736439-Heterocapsa_arctica.AAC.1
MSACSSGLKRLGTSDSTPGLPFSSSHDSLGSLASALILALLWGKRFAQDWSSASARKPC